MSSSGKKAKYWWAVGYIENMPDDWEESISDKLQLPYAYCVHNRSTDSKGLDRKVHVHLIVVFPNTTTEKYAFEVFNKLSLPGKIAFPKITLEPCVSIRHCYDYLIHDTDECRKKGKESYSVDARLTGNGFDIGLYEQISDAEKRDMRNELTAYVINEHITNYTVFNTRVLELFDAKYLDIVCSNSSHFARLCKANYQLAYIKHNEERHKKAL